MKTVTEKNQFSFWRTRTDSFWRNNGLSLVFLALTLVTIGAQALVGWHEHNQDRLEDYHLPTLSFLEYLNTGHFIEAIFENWESEFLQMGLYVILTAGLYQKGSAESKDPEKEEEVDREPQPKPDAPWPVRKGGWVLKLYKHSLSLAFLFLFVACLVFHAQGGMMEYNLEQASKGKPLETLFGYLTTSRFWFESLQNWQSEFLAVLSIVVLSIFLRQKGSPESKPVDAAFSHTGK